MQDTALLLSLLLKQSVRNVSGLLPFSSLFVPSPSKLLQFISCTSFWHLTTHTQYGIIPMMTNRYMVFSLHLRTLLKLHREDKCMTARMLIVCIPIVICLYKDNVRHKSGLRRCSSFNLLFAQLYISLVILRSFWFCQCLTELNILVTYFLPLCTLFI